MNIRQRKFVHEYCIDFNATRAAIRAGYSPKTAQTLGYNLVRNVEVANAIAEIQADLKKKYEVTIENVVREFAKIAFSDIRDYLDDNQNIKKMDEVVAEAETNTITKKSKKGEAVVLTKTRIKLYDKLRALENLGKHLGIYKSEQIQLNIPALEKLTDDELISLFTKLINAASPTKGSSE